MNPPNAVQVQNHQAGGAPLVPPPPGLAGGPPRIPRKRVARIPESDIARARSSPIAQVWERLNLPPVREGVATNSPFRDDVHPSLQVGGAKNIAFDYASGEAMDPIALVQRVKDLDFPDAVRWINGDMTSPTTASSVPPKDPVEQLAGIRKWNPEALRAMGAQASNGEVLFPMRDSDGAVIGYRTRRADGHTFGPDGPKAMSTKGSTNCILGVWPIPEGETVLVTEGEADVAAALSAGYRAVVGTPGANPGRKCSEALQTALSGRDVVLANDPDPAGREWLCTVGTALFNARCNVRFIPALSGYDLDKRLRFADDPATTLRELVEKASLFVPPDENPSAPSEGPDPSWARLLPVDEKGAPIPLNVARRIYTSRPALVCVHGDFYDFTGKVFEEMPTQTIDREALGLIGTRARRSNLGDIRHLLGVECHRPGDFFQADNGDWIAVANGMLNVRTREVRPHAPQYRCRNLLPVEYDEQSTAPRFEQALEEWHPGDKETQAILCEWIGLCLIPDVSYDAMLVLVGEGANGKSRFVRVLENMLGRENVLGVALTALRTERTFPAAALVGKLVNLCPETETTGTLDEGFIKAPRQKNLWANSGSGRSPRR